MRENRCTHMAPTADEQVNEDGQNPEERLSDKEMIDLMLDVREAELEASFSGGSGGSGSSGDDDLDDDDPSPFALRLTPLHEVAYQVIAKAMDSDDFRDEMAETARVGRSVHKQAGLRLYDEVIHGIDRENARRDSKEMKIAALRRKGWKQVGSGRRQEFYPPHGDPDDAEPWHKAVKQAGVKIKELTHIDKLDERMTIQILMRLETIIKVDLTGLGEHDKAPLAVYDKQTGLHFTDEVLIQDLISQVNPGLSGRQPENAMNMLRASAALVNKTHSARYIPVNNGVFDHSEKTLLDFSDEFVFLNKIPINYNPNAVSPVIIQPDGTEWEFCDWLRQLAIDHLTGEEQEGVYELLWEILSAVVRPGVRYNKAVFLYSKQGNNGKGTFCQVARNLKGERGHTSIPISRFAKPFALTPLMHADAVITDENPVGAFSQELDVFKSVITGDTFTLERKHKDPYNARFEGVMVQCINDIPKSRDKSASLARRQLFVPFKNHFGGDGVERKHIKADYLQRTDVLEFVLMTCLRMDHTSFSEPEATKQLMEQVQLENNAVKAFWYEHKDRYAWDLLPYSFLYDHFKAWFADANPSGVVVGKQEFWSQMEEAVRDDPQWEFRHWTKQIHTLNKMDAAEHIIHEYDLQGWMNPKAKGSADLDKKCSPIKAKQYRGGLVRM